MNTGHPSGSSSSENSSTFKPQQRNKNIQSVFLGTNRSSSSSGGALVMSNSNPSAAKTWPEFCSSSFTGYQTRTPFVNPKMAGPDHPSKKAMQNRLSLESISSMNKSLEELRWNYYQAKKKRLNTSMGANKGVLQIFFPCSNTITNKGFQMNNTNFINFALGPVVGSQTCASVNGAPIKFHPTITKYDGFSEISISNIFQFQSISAMKEYENKSFEELRWNYYQAVRKEPSTSVAANMGGLQHFFSGGSKGFQTTNTFFNSFASGSVLGSQACSASVTGTPTKFYPTITMHDGLLKISACHLFRFQSISAMKEYENKSLEELRWEDYQAGRQRHIPISNTARTSRTGMCGFGTAQGIFFGQQQASNIKLSNQAHGEGWENPLRKNSTSRLLQPVVLNLVQQIPGISRVKAIALLQKFPSIHQLSNASVQELEPVVGQSVAQYIWTYFHCQFN